METTDLALVGAVAGGSLALARLLANIIGKLIDRLPTMRNGPQRATAVPGCVLLGSNEPAEIRAAAHLLTKTANETLGAQREGNELLRDLLREYKSSTQEMSRQLERIERHTEG